MTTIEQPRILSSFADHDGFVDAVRGRLLELNISYETLDALAGWTNTYATKLLNPLAPNRKHFGVMSLSAVLPAIGCQLALVEDPEALDRIKRHSMFITRRRAPDKETAMAATQRVGFSNISATTDAFQLKGGKYSVSVIATWGGGSVKLQQLGPDSSTYMSVASATDFTANGLATVDLPPGQYKFVVATASAIYASACSVP